MARQTADAEQPDTQVVLERMTDILEQLQRNAPPNEPGFGHPEYQKRLREEGFFDEFATPVYQNGKEAQARGLKPETIERAPKLRPPGILELEELLGDYLSTRVQISMGPRRGRMQIDFATLEDLERIYRTMTENHRLAGT